MMNSAFPQPGGFPPPRSQQGFSGPPAGFSQNVPNGPLLPGVRPPQGGGFSSQPPQTAGNSPSALSGDLSAGHPPTTPPPSFRGPNQFRPMMGGGSPFGSDARPVAGLGSGTPSPTGGAGMMLPPMMGGVMPGGLPGMPPVVPPGFNPMGMPPPFGNNAMQIPTGMQAMHAQMRNIVQDMRKQKHTQDICQDKSIPPNLTLYVNNLDDRVAIDVLKRDLRELFEPFGEVVDVIAMKSFWRRGQAFVLFKDQASADKAIEGLQGFPYKSKPMRVNYAREKSHYFQKEDGTFVPKEKDGPMKPRKIIEREQKLKDQLSAVQQQAMLNSDAGQGFAKEGGEGAGQAKGAKAMESEVKTEEEESPGAPVIPAAAGTTPQPVGLLGAPQGPGLMPPGVLVGANALGMAAQQQPAPSVASFFQQRMSASSGTRKTAGTGEVSRKIRLENIPIDVTEGTLKMLLKQFGSLDSISLNENGYATAEYSTEQSASAAVSGLRTYQIRPGHTLKISFCVG